MAFIYERISEQDIARYGLHEIDRQFPSAQASRWVIDRERQIYLRYMNYDREQASHKHFSFFSGAVLLRLNLSSVVDEHEGGTQSITWSMLDIRAQGQEATQFLEQHRQTVMTDIKDALRAYKNGFLDDNGAEYAVHFDF